MRPGGGLKLALEAPERNERRVRFATVRVSATDGENVVTLVTDARGRLRYPLRAGEYRLELEHGGTSRFAVRERGWTPVHVRLS